MHKRQINLESGGTRDNFIVEKKNLSTASMGIGFGDSANGRRESKKSLIQIVNGGKIILKGTVGLSQGVVLLVNNSSLVLGNHCVVAYGSLLTKAEPEDHILYAGVPAKQIRKEINWRE